jgi:hypothetical protein
MLDDYSRPDMRVALPSTAMYAAKQLRKLAGWLMKENGS